MTEKNLPTAVQQHISGLEQRIAELEEENRILYDALEAATKSFAELRETLKHYTINGLK